MVELQDADDCNQLGQTSLLHPAEYDQILTVE